ncbi:scavenger receptor cysteine-rich domain-containing protein DMBT1-like [Mustelus asterias]
MWEIVEAPRLPEVHIYAGCVELRLLRDRVRELELQLEDIRLVRENEEWYGGTVCEDSWDRNDAAVVYRRLNWPANVDSGRQVKRPSERHILNRRVTAARSSVQPSSQSYTVDGVNDKELRDVRLVGREAPCIGQLKIYYRGQWGSVCSSLWDSTTGDVVCRQIGCTAYHTTITTSISQDTGPILMDKFRCNGTESSLWQCPFSTADGKNCETGELLGLFCKVRIQLTDKEVGKLNSWKDDQRKAEKMRVQEREVEISKHSSAVRQKTALKDGGSPCAGRVEASSFQSWRILCGRKWDLNEAHVFCKFLNCGYAVSASGNSQFGVGAHAMLNVELLCNGTEDDPWKCEKKQLTHRNCSIKKEAAGVVCSGHRQPRLIGGADGCSGRLEIEYGATWGTVCDSHWDFQDARVVCASLKCGDVISVLGEAHFGEGSDPIWQDAYECRGNETKLWECPTTPVNRHNCTHNHDVSVICSGEKGPRLVDGNISCSGRVEILQGDTWGTVCDTYWDVQDANVVCNQLGCGTAISAPGNAFFGEGNGSIWNDIYQCVGNEMRLSDCRVLSKGQHRCTHRNDAGVLCSGELWQIRLANGESLCDGRLEVYYGGVWGRVIDTQWNFNDADVVCRQLNCGSAISVHDHLRFGKGLGPVWISNVRCNGSESFLWNCSFEQTDLLSTADDVGVVCSDNIQVRLMDGGSHCAGRVELYYNGTWGTVCDDSWDITDAHVVCNQLKCGEALNATVSGWFGLGSGPIWLDNLKCTANDSVFWECLAGPWAESDCNHKEDAGVICSEHRAVRLQNGANSCQGRVEVLYNATWGTVCGDLFGLEDAEVVCKQLSCGPTRSVDYDVTFGAGSGQIWLDDVNCRLRDSLLWQCPSSPWGQHNCDHQEDVGVICSEKNPMKIRNDRNTRIKNMGPVSDDVELRLAAGFNNCSGRVEIFFSGTWGTVCDDSWDKNDAAVVCRQLNCGEPLWTPVETRLDQQNGTIWMDEVKCKGSELFLWDCQFSSWGDHDCEHKEDVNVICSGHQQYIAPFNQQRFSVFITLCIFAALFVAVSIALAAEFNSGSHTDNRNRRPLNTGFPEPLYEEIDIEEFGPGPDLHSNSSMNDLEYYTDFDLHECEHMQYPFTSCDAELGREYDDVQ